jgi:hypothetical protein
MTADAIDSWQPPRIDDHVSRIQVGIFKSYAAEGSPSYWFHHFCPKDLGIGEAKYFSAFSM